MGSRDVKISFPWHIAWNTRRNGWSGRTSATPPEVKVAQLDMLVAYLLHVTRFNTFKSCSEAKPCILYVLHAHRISLTSDTAERPWKISSLAASQDFVSALPFNSGTSQLI